VRPVDQVEPHSSPPPLPPEKEAEGRRRRREEIREDAAAAAAGGAGRWPWKRVLRRTNILGFRWLEWAVALPRFQW